MQLRLTPCGFSVIAERDQEHDGQVVEGCTCVGFRDEIVRSRKPSAHPGGLELENVVFDGEANVAVGFGEAADGFGLVDAGLEHDKRDGGRFGLRS